MTHIPKIGIGYHTIRKRSEISELIELLFPGNPNQQYAALAIVLELKWSKENEYQGLGWVMEKHNVPERIFERAREKLHKLGILEHATNLSSRTGRHGWRLSSRFSNSLKALADKYSELVENKDPARCRRDFIELNYIMKRF